MFGYQGLQKAAKTQAPIGSKVKVFHPHANKWVDGVVTSHYFVNHNRNEAPSWGIIADLQDGHLTEDGRKSSNIQCDYFKMIQKGKNKTE